MGFVRWKTSHFLFTLSPLPSSLSLSFSLLINSKFFSFPPKWNYINFNRVQRQFSSSSSFLSLPLCWYFWYFLVNHKLWFLPPSFQHDENFYSDSFQWIQSSSYPRYWCWIYYWWSIFLVPNNLPSWGEKITGILNLRENSHYHHFHSFLIIFHQREREREREINWMKRKNQHLICVSLNHFEQVWPLSTIVFLNEWVRERATDGNVSETERERERMREKEREWRR